MDSYKQQLKQFQSDLHSQTSMKAEQSIKQLSDQLEGKIGVLQGDIRKLKEALIMSGDMTKGMDHFKQSVCSNLSLVFFRLNLLSISFHVSPYYHISLVGCRMGVNWCIEWKDRWGGSPNR